MKIRNRIKSLRRVEASQLKPNPKNWRTHPKEQQEALKGILAEVGYADALLCRELEDGSLMLVDGHLRAETTPDEKVPVLVLDIDEAESDKLLLSLDPLAALAETNAVALDGLLHEVNTGNEGLSKMYSDLAAAADLYETKDKEEKENPYTDKQVAPIYEPTGEQPKVAELCNMEKFLKLKKEVEKSKLPKDMKTFLVAAAYRHVVFDFEKVAEYYAHADADTQKLFEDSALVIIDFDKAIEDGYTQLGKELEEVYELDEEKF